MILSRIGKRTSKEGNQKGTRPQTRLGCLKPHSGGSVCAKKIGGGINNNGGGKEREEKKKKV